MSSQPNVLPSVWILLACDRPDRRDAFRVILEQAGFGVEFVTHGPSTVERARTRHYDLVLMDLQAQITHGLRSAATIREMERQRGQVETPIVAILGRSVEGSEEYCRTLGMTQVLRTPVPTGRFVRQIQQLVSMRETSVA